MRAHATLAIAPATFSAASLPGFVPVEHDGDVPGGGVGQQFELLDETEVPMSATAGMRRPCRRIAPK